MLFNNFFASESILLFNVMYNTKGIIDANTYAVFQIGTSVDLCRCVRKSFL